MLIGDVARRSGVSARMLRHYESLGLVRPTGRTGSGYRRYSEEDIRRILHIESLRSLGLSLRDVGRALDDPGFAPAELVEDLIRRTRERIAAETELLTRLRRLDAAEPAGWEEALQVVSLLQALESKSPGTRQRAALSAGEDVPVPVEALVEAVLGESDPIVAGALRWALAQAGGDGAVLLAEGLRAPEAEVRERAVRSIAELPDGTATALLRDALGNPDAVVRRYAALALGARGGAEAVPTLVDMVVEAVNDADAADALAVLAGDPALAERIATGLVDRLTHGARGRDDGPDAGGPDADGPDAGPDALGPDARRRLTQALADIPGSTASRALEELSRDGDRAVALTATYILKLRDTR
ncbi:MerR family transcriptional regulator [Kitasatospora sp. NPDC004799]|uniref:HEAT repeat domain-containing protein n=1 Tax=Kitasatospora sp. NPDC004799 TaxID=3154460 RepID=UPI0033A4535A